jgi:hypothetical protein
MGEGAQAEIEVRQLFELEDFGASEAVQRFRDIRGTEEVGVQRLRVAAE